MPRNQTNSRKRVIKKDHPPTKKNIKVTNVPLRRSTRRRSSAFVSRKITTNRLTLPLTFFDDGIKSETVTAARVVSAPVSSRIRHILNEDLLALIPPTAVGRTQVVTANVSEDTSAQRIARSLHSRYLNASSYYLDCINKQEAHSDTQKANLIPSKSDNQTDTSASFRKSQEAFEISYSKDFKDAIIQTDTAVPDRTAIVNDRYRPVNYKFCRNIFNQITVRLKSTKKKCFLKLKESVQKVNDILDGKRTPTSPPESMSAKRRCDEDYDKVLTSIIPLVPQSQWVYSTPDKQNMKQFVFEEGGSDKILPAVIRTSRKSKVLYDIKNEVMQHVNLSTFNAQNIPIDRRYLKTICENSIENNGDDIVLPKQPSKKQRIAGSDGSDDTSNKENLFAFVAPAKKSSEFVFQPQPRCTAGPSAAAAAAPAAANPTVKDEFNVFLSGGSEESIDIQQEIQRGTEGSAMDVSFELKSMEETIAKDLCDMNEKYGHFDFRQCRSALPKDLYYLEKDPYESAPVDYRHQLLMATQRPAKNTRKIQKRHLLKAKSLSFDNTPPGAKVAVFEPKRIDMLRRMEEDCVDQFEKEFCALSANNSAADKRADLPHTITSGVLAADATTTSDLPADRFVVDSFNENLQTMFKFYPRRNYDPE